MGERGTSLAYAAVSRVLIALLCALALGLAACGGDDDSGDGGGSDSGSQQEQPAEQQPAEEEQAGCQDIEQPPTRDGGGQQRPTDQLDPGKTYVVEFETSCGDFSVRLDQKTSPNAAASFAALARDGFFDGTIFHRIVPGFVIQGGDPTATGTGGPGYSTRDRVPADAAYEPGVVAMAKAGNEPAGTAGSQFFVVTAAGTGLTPDYALLGRVTSGMDVVQAIGELGDPASGGTGIPLQSVAIEKASVRER
jgi:peptidyl-prolyl cis-trans isomerase B (cyclophilin B)